MLNMHTHTAEVLHIEIHSHYDDCVVAHVRATAPETCWSGAVHYDRNSIRSMSLFSCVVGSPAAHVGVAMGVSGTALAATAGGNAEHDSSQSSRCDSSCIVTVDTKYCPLV